MLNTMDTLKLYKSIEDISKKAKNGIFPISEFQNISDSETEECIFYTDDDNRYVVYAPFKIDEYKVGYRLYEKFFSSNDIAIRVKLYGKEKKPVIIIRIADCRDAICIPSDSDWFFALD